MTAAAESISKTEAAYRTLRREILHAKLAPGLPLKLGTLRTAYGLGWTPLREALSRLEAERLVVASRNRGYAVAPMLRGDLEDLQSARLAVELPALLESMQRGGEEWEAAVITAHYRLSRCKLPVDDFSDAAVSEWEDRHEAFHAALIGACTSQWLLRFHRQISDQMRRYHRVLNIGPAQQAPGGDPEALAMTRAAMAIEHHTQLMEATLDRNVDRARVLLTEHVESTVKVFVKAKGAPTATPAVHASAPTASGKARAQP